MGWNSRAPEITGSNPDSWSRSLAELQSFQGWGLDESCGNFFRLGCQAKKHSNFSALEVPIWQDWWHSVFIFVPALIIKCCPWQQLETHMAHAAKGRTEKGKKDGAGQKTTPPWSSYLCSSHDGSVLCSSCKQEVVLHSALDRPYRTHL